MTKTIEVGTLARWKKGRKADRRHTFTVREVGATEVMIDNGTPGVPDFPANGATVLVCVKPGEIEPWGDEPPTFTMAAKLASSLAAMTVERDEARREVGRYMDAVIETDTERDRLAREVDRLRDVIFGAWSDIEHTEHWPEGRMGGVKQAHKDLHAEIKGLTVETQMADAARIDPEPAAG